MTFEEIISKIQSCTITDGDEFDVFIDDIAVEVEDIDFSVVQKERLIEQLFLFIESQPDPEFTSWSLVHFIEWLDKDYTTNYSTQLLTSLKRKPTFLALLLANRMLNDLPDTSADRALFLTALKEVASNGSLEEYVRNEANEFYEYQLNKEAKS